MPGKTHPCTLCSKVFPSFANLDVHFRSHTGERPFKCDICGKGFTQTGSLTLHKRTHSGVKPFKCGVCKMLFTQKINLQVHQRIHTGEKPFQCTICSKSFSQQSNLNQHKKAHLSEKLLKCEICKKSFGRQESLKAHQMSHTSAKRNVECEQCQRSIYPDPIPDLTSGESSYSCQMCGKDFQNISLLHAHMKLHLGPLADKCTGCARAVFSQLRKLNEGCKMSE